MANILATKAMLVRFSRSQWNQYAFDKAATAEVTQAHNADSKAGRFNKKLLEGSVNLKAVQKAYGAVYTHHMANTLPWADQGLRILPSANYFDYLNGHRPLVAAAEAAVNTFTEPTAYAADVQADQSTARLGTLFDPDLYPSPEYMKSLYGITLRFLPIPDEADFRVDLPNEVLEEVRRSTQVDVSQAMTEATKDLYARLLAPLKAMRDKLAVPIGMEGAMFRDSLVGNVQDVINLLPKLNITGDKNLEILLCNAAREFESCTPASLRVLPQARKATQEKADALIAQMSAYMGGL